MFPVTPPRQPVAVPVSEPPWLRLTLGVVLLTAIFRFWVEATHGLPLYVDEAYYWYWSRDPAWGYFSKPPVIAWLIWLTTSLCGDTALCVRAGSLILYPATALIIYRMTARLVSGKAGFFAALAFLLMPAVTLGSMVISTDAPLLFFWALTLYLFILALETEKAAWWLAAGVACGLGLLTKYTMFIWPLSALLFLATQLRYRYWLFRWEPYAAGAIALAIFSPNLLWNIAHDFPTLRHTAHISNLASRHLHWDEFVEFTTGQFLVFGPVLGGLLIAAAVSAWRQGGTACRLGLAFVAPMLLVIMLQSLLGRANANWAAPAYVAASLLVGVWVVARRHPRWLLAGLLFNVSLMGVIYYYDALTASAGVSLTAANDPYKRARGWDRFGQIARELDQRETPQYWVADDRELLSQLAWQLRDHWSKLRSYNPRGEVRHQLDIVASLDLEKLNSGGMASRVRLAKTPVRPRIIRVPSAYRPSRDGHRISRLDDSGLQRHRPPARLIYVSRSPILPEALKRIAGSVDTLLLNIPIHRDYCRLIYFHRLGAGGRAPAQLTSS
ncbi:MAG TPA: glycosyltransferase family 39 protein [Gammaproteobacteria bacterium]|nr:glycosyltransferase family 39 protein [Gammaproteobacteria bacterium]